MADTKAPARKSAPALDLTSLVPTEAVVPKSTRETKHRDNPFLVWLAESYENGKGKSVTVPAANAGEIEYLIRRAADELNIGARVVVQDGKGNTLSKDERKAHKGNVVILFIGKNRKNRKAKDESATA